MEINLDHAIIEVLEWKDRYLSPKSFVLALGESYIAPVTVKLARIPHILGQAVRVLCSSCCSCRRSARAQRPISRIPPRSGMKKSRMYFAEEDLRDALDRLVAELEYRKSTFKASGCQKISTPTVKPQSRPSRGSYSPVTRWQIVTLLSQIKNNSTAIARQGRALRNSLVLAMQRPGTTILPGQIQQHGFPCLRQGG